MGDTNPTIVESAKTEMDEMIAGVMPASWEGHGRLKISERDFSPEDRDFAHRVHAKLSREYPDADSTRVAQKAIEAVNER